MEKSIEFPWMSVSLRERNIASIRLQKVLSANVWMRAESGNVGSALIFLQILFDLDGRETSRCDVIVSPGYSKWLLTKSFDSAVHRDFGMIA